MRRTGGARSRSVQVHLPTSKRKIAHRRGVHEQASFQRVLRRGELGAAGAATAVIANAVLPAAGVRVHSAVLPPALARENPLSDTAPPDRLQEPRDQLKPGERT